jgi:hypothetical protein
MILDGQEKNNRERFFVRNVTGRQGFGLRHNKPSGLSRIGDRHLKRLRFGHVAGFENVPWPAAGLKARPPGGARKGNHTNQQEHDARDKKPPVMRDDSLHAFADQS